MPIKLKSSSRVKVISRGPLITRPSIRTVTLPNMEKAFSEIRTHGDRLAFNLISRFPQDGYRQPLTNSILGMSHFQGIQRLAHGNYLAVTGSSDKESHLFIVKMGSRPPVGRLRSNVIASTHPPEADKIVKVEPIDRRLTHAGGFQVLSHIAAIGIEGHGRSEVVFYDLSTPENPQKLPYKISRPNDPAGAVGITRMMNNKYLLVVGQKDSDILDFYISTGNNLSNPNFRHVYEWKEKQLTGMDREFGNYQNLNLIRQRDGQIFLVGLHRNTPFGPGQDFADLFTVALSSSTNRILIRKIANRHMVCKQGGNFDAGAGVYIDGRRGLFVYAVDHWLRDGKVKINEFRPVPASVSPPITSIRRAWVELYDDKHFKDRSVMIDYIDQRQRNYLDYDKVEGFEDKTSSAKWLLPADWQYLLFEDKRYKGRMIRLSGTGNVSSISDIKGWNDKVSSSKFAKKTVTRISEAWVELYDDRNFKDRRLTIRGGSAAATRIKNYKKKRVEGKRGFGDKVSSARWQIPKGYTYRLYEHDSFRGKTINLAGNGEINEIANFRSRKFNDKVSSSKYS